MSEINPPREAGENEQEPQSAMMNLNDDNVEEIMLASKIRGMSRTKKIIICLAAFAVLALGAFGYYRWLASGSASDYLTMAVTKTTITDSIEATGTLEPVKKSEMGFKNDGTITAINVNPGDKVIKGQVLAKQDPNSLTSALAQAQNTVDQDAISVKSCNLSYQAKLRSFEQQKKLQEAGAAALTDLDTAQDDLTKAELELATAKSKLANDQLKVAQAQSDLSEATLIAPFDGVIGAVNGQVGQINGINSSTSTLLTVMSEDLQLTALVNEADIGEVKPGLKVEFTSTTYSNKTFTGKVIRITPEAQAVSNVQYYPVLISCSDPDRLLKSGMTVSAEIIISRKADVVTVPKMAVTYAQTYMKQNNTSSENTKTPGTKAGSTVNKQASSGVKPSTGINGISSVTSQAQPPAGFAKANRSNGRPGIILVLKNEKPSVKQVTLGVSDESNYEVISGLDEGDQVVVGTSQSTNDSSNSSSNSNSSSTKRNMDGGMGGPPPGL